MHASSGATATAAMEYSSQAPMVRYVVRPSLHLLEIKTEEGNLLGQPAIAIFFALHLVALAFTSGVTSAA